MEHVQRLHRRRRLQAAGQPRAAGRTLFALVLVSIILGVLVTLPGQEEVRAWVHQVHYSVQTDRVGVLPPPDGR
jgi:hypothetical protein